jgi:hypothetical protein
MDAVVREAQALGAMERPETVGAPFSAWLCEDRFPAVRGFHNKNRLREGFRAALRIKSTRVAFQFTSHKRAVLLSSWYPYAFHPGQF